jgi:hypothetical protein
MLAAGPGCAAIWGFADPLPTDGGAGEAGLEGGVDATSFDSAKTDVESGADVDSGRGAIEAAAQPCSAACVPAAPSNWQGPLQIAEATGGPPPPVPPDCDASAAYPKQVYEGMRTPVAPDAGCSCTCGPPSGTTCDSPLANYFSDNMCTASCGTTNQPITTACTTLSLGGCGGTHITLTDSVASGGSCVPDAGTTIVPAGWTARVRLCEPSTTPTTSGCDAGQVCAPAVSLPFQTGTYCIARSGTWTCPTDYPTQRIYYAGSSDTRACTPCACGPASGATCSGGTATFYGGGSCSGGSTILSVPQTCTNLGGAQVGVFSGAMPSGGGCVPEGGVPTGSFQPTTPTTVCCTQ